MRPLHACLVWAAITGALFTVPACYGHTCEGDFVFYGRNPGEGHLVSPDLWESNRVTEGWLEFPHQRTYFMDLHELGADREPVLIVPSVSAQANPLAENGNFTNSAGNLTTLTANKGSITVHNDTCADYYLRVVVTAAPSASTTASPPDAGPPDASPEGGTPTLAP